MEVERDSDGAPLCRLGDAALRFENEPCREPRVLLQAERELRETAASARAAAAALRDLLREERELVVPRDDDGFLLKFLRPCKFYPHSALQRMKNYYQFRADNPRYCGDLLPSSVRAPFESGVISALSPRDSAGRRYILIEAGEAWDYRAVPLQELFRGLQVALEAAMAEPRTQVCGVLCVLDMKGLSFGHVMQFTPLFAKLMVDFIQDCLPIRLKGVHVINQPYIFNMLFALFKPFLRDKLRSRIHFHGTDRASLLRHAEACALRRRHGGDMPDPEIPGRVMWEMLLHYEPQFRLANSYGYPAKMKK